MSSNNAMIGQWAPSKLDWRAIPEFVRDWPPPASHPDIIRAPWVAIIATIIIIIITICILWK